MNVCIDVQSAIGQRTGVGRYTKALAEHLPAYAEGDALRLCYFDFRGRGAPFPAPGAAPRAVRWIPGRCVQAVWKTIAWPPYNWFAGAADVYHFPNFICPPLSRGKAVVTIHDLALLRYPETLETKNRRYLARRIGDTVRRADAIIAVSQFTAAELQALLRVPADRICTVLEGLEAHWQPPPPAALAGVRRRYGLDRPYLLTVGTLEPRKNLPLLIEAFERLTGFDGDLVLAGMPGWKYGPILRRMRDSPQARRLRWLNYVADSDLPALYAGAELFVIASLYEGFGFPPLEAMACGTPVVASRGGSLPEILGNAAAIVNGFEVAAWVAAIDRLLHDSAARAEAVIKGQRQAARYRWPETARQTWAVYRKVGA